MGIATKAWQSLRAKTELAVDRLADPRESLENSYQRLVELLAKIRAEQPGSPAIERLEVTVEILRARKEAIRAAESEQKAEEAWLSISEDMDNHQRRREILTQLSNSTKELAAARDRLDQQLSALNQQQVVLEEHARQARDTRDDLACEALARKAEIKRQLSDLAARRDRLRTEEEKFTTAYERLAAGDDEMGG